MVNHHHHHYVAPPVRIPLTLSRYPSLSSIASGRSSGQHPISTQTCCMWVLAGRPAFARPCEGVQRSTSLMNSSLLLQQYPACLVRLTWIVYVMGGRWPWCNGYRRRKWTLQPEFKSVEGGQKAPFSIATSPRCRGARYSFPWIALLYP